MQYTRLLALALVSTSLSCGSCGEDSPPEEASDCPDITLETSATQPLDRIPIAPVSIKQSFIVQYDVDGEWLVAPAEFAIDSDDLHIVTPVHPDGIAGGPVKFRIVDDLEAGTCGGAEPKTYDHTILPLDPSPGATHAVVAELESAAAASAVEFGVSPEDLRTAPLVDLPLELWPSRIAIEHLSSDTVPDNVSALLDGSAPSLAGSSRASDIELADALIAKSGILAELQAYSARIGTIPQPEGGVRLARVTVTPSDSEEAPAPPGALIDAELLRVDIANADELSYYMQVAQSRRDIVESGVLKTTGDIVSLLGVLPGVGQAAAVCGVLLYAAQEFTEESTKLMPWILRGSGYELDKEVFEEDSDYVGAVWELRGVAESKRWKASQTAAESIAEIIFAAKGIKGASGSLADVRRVQGNDILKGVAEGQLDNAAKSQAANALDFGVDSSDNTAYVGPFFWGPFDLTSPPGDSVGIDIAVESPNLEAFVVADESSLLYRTNEPGVAYLELWANPEYYPPTSNRYSSRTLAEVEVKQIEVTVDPTARVVTPGQEVSIRAIVENALDDRLEWSASAGTLVEVDNENVLWTAPDQIGDGELITVTAVAITETGLREPSIRQGPREATAIFSTKEKIVLYPGFACLSPGESIDVEAQAFTEPGREDALQVEVTDGEYEGMRAPGSNTEIGVYVAPEAEGEYEIIATLAGSEVREVATIRVGQCDCFFNVNVLGRESFGGVDLEYSNIGTLVVAGNGTAEQNATHGFTLAGTGEGDTVSGVITAGPIVYSIPMDDTPAPTLDVIEEDDRSLRAKVSGIAGRIPPDPLSEDVFPTPFSISFKVLKSSADPDGRCPTEDRADP